MNKNGRQYDSEGGYPSTSIVVLERQRLVVYKESQIEDVRIEEPRSLVNNISELKGWLMDEYISQFAANTVTETPDEE